MDTNGQTARYVRVQLTGEQDPAFSLLSVAELQVFEATESTAPAASADSVRVEAFESNFANETSIVIDRAGRRPFNICSRTIPD